MAAKLTHQQIANHFGVTKGAIQKWERVGLDRNWTIEEIVDWKANYDAAKGRERSVALDKKLPPDEPRTPAPSPETVNAPLLTLSEARTEKLRKEVARLEIKIAREKGELVPIDDVRETCIKVVSVWCAELDALVSDLPGQIGGLGEAEILPKLKARIELLKRNATQGFAAL